MEERKKREIDPTLTMLRQCVQELKSDKKTPVAVQRRIENMLGFISTLDTWFDQVKRLPRPTLIVLMKIYLALLRLKSVVNI